MNERYEFREGMSAKFWSVSVVGRRIITRWGKIGSAGREKQQECANEATARAGAQSAAQKKRKKGYMLCEANKVFAAAFESSLDALVAAIRADPRVGIENYHLASGASDTELDAAEVLLGWPLPADLRALFGRHDGWYLQWDLGVEGSERSESSSFWTAKAFEDENMGLALTGCVCIPPVAEFSKNPGSLLGFESEQWSELFGEEVAWPEDDDEREELLLKQTHNYLFDGCGGWNFAFVVFDRRGAARVLMASDSGADYSAPASSVAEYLERTIASFTRPSRQPEATLEATITEAQLDKEHARLSQS